MSRNAHRWREEPAGPEHPTPAAQCLGPWTAGLAVYPHPGSWHQDGVLEQMERYQHDLVAAPGTGPPLPAGAGAALEDAGLAVEGEGVVLSALRRRGDWLELRLACQHPAPVTVTVGDGLTAAQEADLLGRPGTTLPLPGGTLRLDLAAWEIRTVQLRRDGRSTEP
jgi:mannosylglycerate hydrolase